MRSKSPDLMDKILKFAEEYYLDNGHSPATSTIAAELCFYRENRTERIGRYFKRL